MGRHAVRFAFSRDLKLVATTRGGEIDVWDIASGRKVRSVKPDTLEDFPTIVFSPDARAIARGSESSAVTLWDVATGRRLAAFDTSGGDAGSKKYRAHPSAFSPDGRVLLVEGGRAQLWDVPAGTLLRSFAGGAARLSPRGRLVAAARKGAVELWDAATGAHVQTIETPWVAFALSGDGAWLAQGFPDGRVRLWLSDEGGQFRAARTLAAQEASDRSPFNGRTLLDVRAEQIDLWDVATGKLIHRFRDADGAFLTMLSPDWRVAAVGKTMLGDGDRHRRTITLSDTATGARLGSLEEVCDCSPPPCGPHAESATGAVFSPNGRLFAFGRRVWDVWAGRPLPPLKKPTSPPFSALAFSPCILAFSPDGRTAVTGFGLNAVRLWDVSTGAPLHVLSGHASNVRGLSFSADGRVLITSGVDGVDKFRDVASGRELLTLVLYEGRDWLAVTPDGLFDGTPAAWSKVHWRFGGDAFRYAPVEAFFADFFYPDLLREIMSGKRPRARSAIIFFAGHGTARRQSFYLIPHDLGYEGERESITPAEWQTVLDHGISAREREQALEGLDARHIVLVIDACNSGQALEAEEKRRGPMNSRAAATPSRPGGGASPTRPGAPNNFRASSIAANRSRSLWSWRGLRSSGSTSR